MIKKAAKLVALISSLLLWHGPSMADERRVPAEWEPQEAIWMQWPGPYETPLREPFARIIRIVQTYQPVHLLVSTKKMQVEAKAFLADRGVRDKNVNWHIVAVDNSWMRDSGPVYVEDSQGLWLQNWEFTGWDGTTGAETENDNLVPLAVADHLDMEVETFGDYVLEKGNLEVNGAGVAMLNWDCQKQRNPGLSKLEHEAILKKALGLKQIIWAYGYHPEDLTTGHIDGIARFVNERTVMIADTDDETECRLEEDLRALGYETRRFAGSVNWLVGNGFVLGMETDVPEWNAEMKRDLKRYFPKRDIYLIDALAIEEGGGGIHCVTNDQPVFDE